MREDTLVTYGDWRREIMRYAKKKYVEGRPSSTLCAPVDPATQPQKGPQQQWPQWGKQQQWGNWQWGQWGPQQHFGGDACMPCFHEPQQEGTDLDATLKGKGKNGGKGFGKFGPMMGQKGMGKQGQKGFGKQQWGKSNWQGGKEQGQGKGKGEEQ